MKVVPAGSPFALAQGAAMGGRAAALFDRATRAAIAAGFIAKQGTDNEDRMERDKKEL